MNREVQPTFWFGLACSKALIGLLGMCFYAFVAEHDAPFCGRRQLLITRFPDRRYHKGALGTIDGVQGVKGEARRRYDVLMIPAMKTWFGRLHKPYNCSIRRGVCGGVLVPGFE